MVKLAGPEEMKWPNKALYTYNVQEGDRFILDEKVSLTKIRTNSGTSLRLVVLVVIIFDFTKKNKNIHENILELLYIYFSYFSSSTSPKVYGSPANHKTAIQFGMMGSPFRM